jgi:hypothetical protein
VQVSKVPGRVYLHFVVSSRSDEVLLVLSFDGVIGMSSWSACLQAALVLCLCSQTVTGLDDVSHCLHSREDVTQAVCLG